MKLLKTFSLYSIASFINKGLMFAIIPFLTNVISPEQNGILSLWSIFIMLIIPFILMGFSNSIVMEYSKLDEDEYKSFFSSSLMLSTISFLIILIIFLGLGNIVSRVIGAPYLLLFWGLLYAYLNIFFEGMLAYLRAINKPNTFFSVSIAKSVLEILLIIWLVIQSKKGAEGKIYSSLSAAFILFLFTLFYFNKKGLLTKNIKAKYLKIEFKFGISQIFFQFNLFVLASTDKYLIAHMLHDTAGLGIYFVANQLAFIINVLVTAFFFSYQPLLYSYLSNLTEENKYRLVKIKYLFAAFLLICTVLLCIAAPVFFHVFIKNTAYHAGIPYVVWNSFAFFFWGLYALFLGYLYYYRLNKVVMIFSVFSSVICVVLNYFFIKEFKIMGAAYADLLTYFILFVAMLFTVKKYVKLDLPWFNFRSIFNFHIPVKLKTA